MSVIKICKLIFSGKSQQLVLEVSLLKKKSEKISISEICWPMERSLIHQLEDKTNGSTGSMICEPIKTFLGFCRHFNKGQGSIVKFNSINLHKMETEFFFNCHVSNNLNAAQRLINLP